MIKTQVTGPRPVRKACTHLVKGEGGVLTVKVSRILKRTVEKGLKIQVYCRLMMMQLDYYIKKIINFDNNYYKLAAAAGFDS